MTKGSGLKLIPALAAEVVAIALAVPAHADMSPGEQSYIATLNGYGIGGASDVALIQEGYTICADLGSGTALLTETEKVMDNLQLVKAQAANVVTDAKENLCPS